MNTNNIEVKFDHNHHPTVEIFRKASYKVFVRHNRVVLNKEERNPLYLRFLKKHMNGHLMPLTQIRKMGLQKNIFARGGKTEVEITDKEGKLFKAEMHCSLSDAYRKNYGIERCLWKIYGEMLKVSLLPPVGNDC